MRKIVFTLIAFVISFSIANSQKKISLDDIWKTYTFYPQTLDELKSMSDGKSYTVLENGEINQYSYKSGKKEKTLFKETDIIKNVSSYTFSKDESLILLATNPEQIYRHSFEADYFIYSIEEGVQMDVSKNGKQQLASLNPAGTRVAFVRKNNLFIKDMLLGAELQITKDGIQNKIINGAPDWVYEEEFSFSKGFEWSPDGKKIAFYKFNEDRVKQYNMPMYGGLYPEKYQYKYPKAGESNAVVSIHVYDVESKKTIKVDIGTETDIYIPRIKWTKDPNTLSLVRLNRLQNKWELMLADANSGESKVIITQTDKRYVEVSDNLFFTDKNQRVVITSEKSGYNHIYSYDINGGSEKQITSGNWDVTKIYGIDFKKEVIYYQSAEASPMQRDVYSIAMNGTGKMKLSLKPGTNDAVFSKSFDYFVNYHSDAKSPSTITLLDKKGKQIRELKNNNNLKDLMSQYGFGTKEFFSFKNTEGTDLNGWMIKPKDFDPNKKYPVLMYVYGGPGSQTVTDEYSYQDVWFQYIAQQGYIVVSVDNRGTGARGAEFKKITYEQLGKYETQDQIDAAKYLGNKAFIDKNRIGIFGWSYGGYMSTLCLEKGADVFKAAIAVAPVTNWRYYDSIYTERYMGLPKDNADGYDNNSPINHVEKIKGNYLLIHGSADDNVHFQNSMEIIMALTSNNIPFDFMVYPNSNHGIYTGKNTRLHLYTKMSKFILEKL